MLKNFLSGHIQFASEASSWQEAIQMAAAPLLKDEAIQSSYVDAMIQNVEINGPYIVILPNFAIPHAKPEKGVVQTSMSLLKLEKPVMFPDSKPVQLLIVLAPLDPDVHLELMSELTDLLIDEEALQKLFTATTNAQIEELL